VVKNEKQRAGVFFFEINALVLDSVGMADMAGHVTVAANDLVPLAASYVKP
jgi:hypothetical protein